MKSLKYLIKSKKIDLVFVSPINLLQRFNNREKKECLKSKQESIFVCRHRAFAKYARTLVYLKATTRVIS